MTTGDRPPANGPIDAGRTGRSEPTGDDPARGMRDQFLAQGDRRVAAQQQQPNDGSVVVPTIDGYNVKFDPRGNFVDVIDENNRPVRRVGLNRSGEATAITLGKTTIYANADRTVDVGTEKGFVRFFADGHSDEFASKGNNKYDLIKRRADGITTEFDEQRRIKSVTTSQGDQVSLGYGPDNKINQLTVTKMTDKGPVVVERAIKEDGILKISHADANGVLKVDERLKDRTDVALRPDLTLDYLDKDGYGLPDEFGREIKREARTVMVAYGDRMVPVNPLRSIRLPDGTQRDYEYASDTDPKALESDGVTGYTLTDRRNGNILEYGQRMPYVPNPKNPGDPVVTWLEYAATAEEALPPEQVNQVRNLMRPADEETMINNRRALGQGRLLEKFMPPDVGHSTASFELDQISGRQYSNFVNGKTFVRTENGKDFTMATDLETGDNFETYLDGTTIKRPWDARPDRHPLDRATITKINSEGIPRVEFHHSRRDNKFIDINYAQDGKTPNELVINSAEGPVRKTLDPNNPGQWIDWKPKNNDWRANGVAPQWEPTGAVSRMSVELVGNPSQVSMERPGDGMKLLTPGTVLIRENNEVRVITPAGEEVKGREGKTYNDIMMTYDDRQRPMFWITSPRPRPEPQAIPQADNNQPPGWTQNPDVPVAPNRRGPRPQGPPRQPGGGSDPLPQRPNRTKK